MTGAETMILLVQIWGGIGVLVSLVFLTIGLGQIDEDARAAVTFRPLLVPGILVLWPLVLWRWWVLASGRDKWPRRHTPPRRSHRAVAITMAVLIPLTLLTSFSIRQTWPSDIAPVKLDDGGSQ